MNQIDSGRDKSLCSFTLGSTVVKYILKYRLYHVFSVGLSGINHVGE